MLTATAASSSTFEDNDTLEIGSLSVQLIAGRNIELPGTGGYMDMLLNSLEQAHPYCRVTLGVCELPEIDMVDSVIETEVSGGIVG